MNPSRKTQSSAAIKYLAVFVVGGLLGAAFTHQFASGGTQPSSSLDDQKEQSAVETSMDAYFLTNALSHIRLNETAQATQDLEALLDGKTIEAGTWLKTSPNSQYSGMVKKHLAVVKWYHEVIPTQPKFETRVGDVLSSVATPQQSAQKSDAQLATVARLRQQHKK